MTRRHSFSEAVLLYRLIKLVSSTFSLKLIVTVFISLSRLIIGWSIRRRLIRARPHLHDSLQIVIGHCIFVRATAPCCSDHFRIVWCVTRILKELTFEAASPWVTFIITHISQVWMNKYNRIIIETYFFSGKLLWHHLSDCADVRWCRWMLIISYFNIWAC